MNNFTLYDPNIDSPFSLLNQITSSIDGIEIDANSVNFIGSEQSTSFFDAINFGQGISLNQTGILLTSGDGTPPLLNTESAYGVDLGFPGDSQLTAIAQSAFGGAGETFDSSILEFSFTRTNSSVDSILIDIIFGSEEFPEYINSSYVDIASVIVNDRNYALIDGDFTKPLSVISATVEDGRFTDNTNGILPIEYNGITQRLVIPIPLEAGVDEYSVRIGIADTGDAILDSGLFVSNFRTSLTNIGEVPLTVVEATSLPFQIDHAFLELLAKVLVYEDWSLNQSGLENELKNSVYNTQNLSYTLDEVWNDESTGFYAIGLIADNAPPLLVIRGTEDALDFLDDANPGGVGFSQFTNNLSVVNWLINQDRTFAPYITAHSLGGALSQWFASYITDITDDLPLGEVVTFNSPGISPFVNVGGNTYGTELFEQQEVQGVTHYVTSADAVSLGGLSYIPGDVKFLDYPAWQTLQIFPYTHFTPNFLESITTPIPLLSEVQKPSNGFEQFSFQSLNSLSFNYNSDLDHAILRTILAKMPSVGPTIAASLGSRLDTEILRTTTGLVIDLADFLANLGQDGLEIVQSAVIAIGNGGAAALEAIANWGVDAWESVSSWTANTWDKASSWTANTWSATKDFTVDAWNSVTDTLQNVASEATQFVVNNIVDLFLPLFPISPFQVFSTTLSETTAMGVGAENANSTVIEVSINISQPSEDVILLDYITANGSAIEGEDYVASSGTVTFQPGETEKLIPIEVLGLDTWQEGKTLSVQLNNPLNVLLLLDDQITVTINPNNAPILLNPIENQEGAINEFLDFQIPDDTFADADQELGDTLTYSATLADGSPLPSWLTFDPVNLIFSGSPQNNNIDTLSLILTATDEAQQSVSAEFILNVIVPEESPVLPAGVNTGTLFEDNEGNNTFQGSTAPDVYNLTSGSSNIIQGTLEQLNQDIIFNFESNDVILVKNVQFTTDQLTITLGSAILEIDVDSNGEADATIILEGDYSNGGFIVEALLNDTKIMFNTPPTEVNLISVITDLDENSVIGEGIKVADVVLVDDALGENSLTVTGADSASFEIRGNELFYVGVSPDFESKNEYQLTVNVQDLSLGEDIFASSDLTLTVLDVNESPTGVNLTPVITELAENTVIGDGIKVGDITITDDALGTNALSLSGADAESFEIRGTELFFIGASPDFETKNQYQVTVNVDDDTVGETPDAMVDFTLAIMDVNEAPTAVNIINSIELAENTVIGDGIKVGDITITDDALGTNALSLSGADAESFEIRGTELFFIGASPDFETKNQYQVTVNVDDETVGDTPDAMVNFTLAVTDVDEAPQNQAPTAIALSNPVTDLAENSVIGDGIKVGDIAVTDDALGTNELSLTGADAESFEIRGTELFYIGANPDFETKNQYQVTVNVDDETVGDTPDATVNFTLAITDVNEAPIVNQPIADQTAQEASVFSLTIPEDTFIDPEADTLFYSASLEDGTTPLPSWLSFDTETLTFSGTPSSDDVGNLTVGVFANDGFLTTSEVFTISIEPIPNNPPTITSPNTFTIPETSNIVGNIIATDPNEEDVLTYSISGGADATFFEINPETGALSFKEAPDFENPLDDGDNNIYDLEVTVTDQGDLTAQSAIAVTVTDVNEAPIVNQEIADRTVTEDSAFNFAIPDDTFTDEDGDTLTYTATLADGTELPQWLSFDGTTFTGTPRQNDVGAIELKVTANDGNGGTVDDTFELTVENVNDSPIVNEAIADQTTLEDSIFNFAIPDDTFTDEDGDTLTYTATLADGTELPQWLSFDGTTFTGTPRQNDVGAIELKVMASDGNGGTVDDTFELTVENVNIVIDGRIVVNASSFSDGEIITPPNSDTASKFIADSRDNIFEPSIASDLFDLTPGGANTIQGTLAQLNEDIMEGFDRTDKITVQDSVLSADQVKVTFSSAILDIYSNNDGDTDSTITLKGDFTDAVFVLNQQENSTEITFDTLSTSINRFRSNDIIGAYIYAGEEESESIRDNYPNFQEEGFAFKVAEEGDSLMRINRFQNMNAPGAYIYAGEEESRSIRANFPNFKEEGIAFYAAAPGSSTGESIYRFQSLSNLGTYIFVGGEERQSIIDNFSSAFVEEGIAFELLA